MKAKGDPMSLTSRVLTALCSAGLLMAQIDRATLNGTVTDSSGAVIAGVKVEALSATTGKEREVLTNERGIYLIPAIPVGRYAIVFSKNEFRTARFENVEFRVGQTLTLDARLDVASVATSVDVKANAVLLERSSAELGSVVDTSEIANLPTNGRNWANLLVLVPGAIDDGGGDQRSIRFGGRGREDNNYMLDGVDATGIQEQAQKSTTRLQVSSDAVEEYRVNSMLYTAEYGAGAGGQVDIVTKAGTNEYHGSLFEYLRNSALDSRSFLDLDLDPAAPPVTKVPPFHMNQFGATFGGPIVKDKTFFFASYEGIRQFRGLTLHAFVPSPSLRSQILSTSPQMAPILGAYPLGQISSCNFSSDPGCADIDEFTHQGTIRIREDSGMLRLDHRWTDKTTLYLRAIRDDSFSSGPLGNLLDLQQVKTKPQNYVIGMEHTFSPSMFNEAKFGVNRAPFHNPQASVFPIAVNSDNFEGLNNTNTDHEVGTSFGWIDNLSIVHGRNTFKIGIEVRRIWLNQGITEDNSVNFTNDASLINDQLDSFSLRSSWWSRGFRHTFVLPYFQDEWKLRKNLTLNLGIRWEKYSVVTEALGRTRVFDLLGCQGICPHGSPMYFPNNLNFDPRFGIAWSPAEKTAIRGGFGIYHGAGQNDDLNAALESDNTRVDLTSSDVSNLSYPIEPFLPQASAVARNPRALFRPHRDLYVEQWGLSVQQSLPHDFVLMTGYSGSHGVRLFARTYINTIDPATGLRPLAGFGQIDEKRNDANSSFHALNVTLQRHLTNGWMWGAQYMWSHSINDGAVGGGESNAPENVLCRRCDRGPSVFDVRHNLVMSSVYELPFGPGKSYLGKSSGLAGKLLGGWELSGMSVWRTGHPLTVTFNPDGSFLPDGNGSSDERPDIVPGVSVVPQHQNANNWINPDAFQSPPTDANGNLLRFGNAGRGLIRSPIVWQVDFSLTKKFKLTERYTLEFIAQAFNIFNHDQLSDPNTGLDYNSPDATHSQGYVSAPGGFGQITTLVNQNSDKFIPDNTGSGLPRQIQFALRLEF
jgi:carboxypeptidase family protein/TonB-dependent receptor-like protein